MPMAGTLTWVRSLITKAEVEVETQKSSWAVWSMVVIKGFIRHAKLTPAAGTLTGGWSLISKVETKVETPRLWAVCSRTINWYIKMRLAKLNPHTDANGNLCVCSCVTGKSGWHDISGACYECRCRSCWPSTMYWTQRWSLGLENFLITVIPLHIVLMIEVKEKDYIREKPAKRLSGYYYHTTRSKLYSQRPDII